jgi:hypothetical protein
MNKETIIKLLESGAEFYINENKIVHPSFRKGFRKLKNTDISWQAVSRAHGLFGTNRLYCEQNIIRIQ